MFVATTTLASDSTAYSFGYATGSLAVFVLGIALLVKGIQKRKAAATPVWTPPTWQPAPPTTPTAGSGDYFSAPPVPAPHSWQAPPAPPAQSKGRGTALIVAGSVILAFSVLGSLGRLVSNVAPKRSVTMPATLLGETRDEEQSAALSRQLAGSLPAEITHSEVAAYTAGGGTYDLIVVVGTGKLGSPDGEIDAFRSGLESSGGITIKGSRSIAAGKLGGKARCYDATISTVPIEICVFTDRGSLFATLDRTTDPALATQRAQEAHDIVVHEG